MPNKGKLFGGLVLLIGGLVFLIVVLTGGILTYQFLKYKNAGLNGLQTAPQAVVAITSPQTFSQAPEGSPQPVNVSSNGYQPLVSTELWVDGILMGVQAAPPGGLFNFNTTFLWSPGPAGEHSLVARTVDAQGNIAVSTAVLVNILPYVPGPDADSGVAFDTVPAMVLPGAAGGGTGGSEDGELPSPGDSVGPAQAGAPSPADWLTGLTNKQPPKAPGLVVSIEGCATTLSIHDLSNNEEGFQIFRSTDYAPGWTEIATLSSQSALNWITYPDTLNGASQASYYVAAVNSAGQAKSNLATASFSSTDCPAAESSQLVLSVEPLSFTTDLPVDQAYCYKSMNNALWERWPQEGFFLPGADGFDIQKYKLTFAVNGLDGKPILKTFDLRLECWGWEAGALKFLGEAHFMNDVSNLREQDEQRGGDISIILKFEVGKPNIKAPSPNPPDPAPTDPSYPYIFALLSYDPNLCKDHLPASAQNVLGVLIFCSPFPAYTLGPGTANPQPYLIWVVSTKKCPAGENADCQFLPELIAYAQTHNGNVQFLIFDSLTSSAATSPYAKASFVIPPEGCIGSHQFQVRLEYTQPAPALHIEGPISNPVTVPCFFDVNSTVGLNVTFDSLTLSNVDDNDGDPPQDVELYGFFQATSSDGSHGVRKLGYWDDYDRDSYDCPDEGFHFGGGLGVSGTGGCPKSYQNGTYSIPEMLLCTSDGHYNCVINNSEGTDFLDHNNTIHLTVGEGDSIVLEVLLNDFDSGSPNDGVCFATIITSSRTALEWAESPVSFGIGQNDNGNAACNVQGTISSTP